MRASRRLMPRGLAGRIALLLTVAIVVANLVAVAIFSVAGRDFDRRASEQREIERVLALVPALEAVPGPVRRVIARRASTRTALIQVDDLPRVAETAGDSRSGDIAQRLTEALDGRDAAVSIQTRQHFGTGPIPGDAMSGADGPLHRLGRNSDLIVLSIALRDEAAPPQWLNMVTLAAPPPDRAFGLRSVLVVMALSLAFVLAGALHFARRLSRPLRDLAIAAEAAGRGDRSARVAEGGPLEVRAAAAAFNAMQAEIGRFEAERMRTLAAVGHDLRTPMTSLRLRAELVEDDSLREPMIRTLDEMKVMADGLVTYAQDARENEEMQNVDLAALLAQVAADRGVALREVTGVTVRGRRVGLVRVFGNLVDNALRYGTSAHLTLDREGDTAVVTVEDDGPGIPPERLEAMFQPFTRGDESRSGETGGAGLGLSIARTIVAAHGGEITLGNRADGGLRATVRLPSGR